MPQISMLELWRVVTTTQAATAEDWSATPTREALHPWGRGSRSSATASRLFRLAAGACASW